jgi:ferritin-like metal-binding protein YciE
VIAPLVEKLEKTHSPRDLFLGDLSAMLEVEKQIAKSLPKMQKAANDHRLSQRLGRHEKETKEQVKRLERAFKALDMRPSRRPAAGIEGLATEFTESSRSVGPELQDVVTLNVASRVEHYEIAAYESLIEMARALGEKEVQQLLERNLKEEKGMLADAGKHARRLNEAAAALEQ